MSPQEKSWIDKTVEYVKSEQLGEGSGHDWWHTYRVWKNAQNIVKYEGSANSLVVELAALLHDIADHKFHGGDLGVGPRVAKSWLEKINVPSEAVEEVADIIANLSFKGAKVKDSMSSMEGKIVQDADRLDAIGAIGIGRTFAYGGFAGQEMHDPDLSPTLHASFEAYSKSKGTTLNHFYEKLLLLKDRMNTPTARKMAEERHQFMEEFIRRFLAEWEGIS